VAAKRAHRLTSSRLGAIAYHLFSGRPPVDSPAGSSSRSCAEGGGLRLAEAVDGIGSYLQDMVRASTTPVVGERIASAGEFLEYLAAAEPDTRAQPPSNVPSIPASRRGMTGLDGDLVVIRKLGRGGTAERCWSDAMAKTPNWCSRLPWTRAMVTVCKPNPLSFGACITRTSSGSSTP